MKKVLIVTWAVMALNVSGAFAQTPDSAAAAPVGVAGAPIASPSAITQASPGAAAEQPPAMDTGVSPNYLIGPGDTLQVFVWRQPELSVSIPVRPDGRISTPLNEDMPAVGKTPTQLARDIEGRLQEYLKKPTVNVIVTHPISRFSQVSIVGQVKQPQSVPFQEGLTVMEAILGVGGPTEFAALKRAKVIRHIGGKRTEIAVNLNAILSKGDMTTNITLQAGDVVVIPESRF
jgi:polysaccharide export outer membrane protein